MVIEKTTSGKFVDLGKRGDSVGDEFFFGSVFWNTAPHPQGRLEPRLLRLRDQDALHCVGTARLDGGTIEYAFQGDSSPNPPTPAITGGTGAFEGAGGHVDIHNLNADGSVTRDVIHITG